MTHIIAIANAKGGVAKTTTTLSLGASLAEMGKKVLIIDLDPHANLTLSLGFKPASFERTVAGLLLGNDDLNGAVIPTNFRDLELVPSNNELNMAEPHLLVRSDYMMLLNTTLKDSQSYDTIIIDCPPTTGTLTKNALSAADLLIIPTQPEYFSAHALRDMLNLILAIRQENNPKLRYRILLTMVDKRNRIHRSLAEQIRTAFNEAIYDVEIEIDTRLRESAILGQPINQYAPESRAAKQYRVLAEETGHYSNELNRRYTTTP
ncbi:MAG: ParA family protein [Chloroflexota bacterium]|nr:ParA family protein [Chloroflexota bacterium]